MPTFSMRSGKVAASSDLYCWLTKKKRKKQKNNNSSGKYRSTKTKTLITHRLKTKSKRVNRLQCCD